MIRSSTRVVASVLALILSLGTLSTFVATSASADPLASKKAEAARIAAQLERLAERASILTEDFNEARVKADEIENRTRNAQVELANTEAKAQSATTTLKDMSRHAYMRGGFEPPSSGIGSSDPARAQYYLQAASNRQKGALDELKVAKAVIAERQASLRASREQARKNLATMTAKRKAAAATEAEQRQLLSRVKGELAQLVAADQARRANAARPRPAAANPSPSRTPSRAPSRNVGTPPTVDVPPPNAAAGAAIEEAKRHLGKPYRYGGSGPDNFDCSGLTSWAWRVGGGRSLPHSSRAQYSATSRVPVSQIAPGDLTFYGSSVSSIHHVGLYVGGGKMINAPQTGRTVEYANAFRSDLIAVGRVN